MVTKIWPTLFVKVEKALLKLLSKALTGLWTTDRAKTNQMTIPFNKLPCSISSFIESSDLVKSMKGKEKFLQDELEEKKQAVRQLQIRSNEMKKMLQKEMKSGGGGSGDPAPNAATSHANGHPESPGRNITPTFSHVFSHDFKDSPSPHSI